jgi:uroporphyrin-III C-methyltransferase / precorrin-2 dehydrogenase / sirohydrochlorin ferrochelatase
MTLPQSTPARIEPLATLPVFFKLKGKRVVLVGASDGAAWKAELLLAAGADLHVFMGEAGGEAFETLLGRYAPEPVPVMAVLDTAIHDLSTIKEEKTWIRGSSPRMMQDQLIQPKGTLTLHPRHWTPDDLTNATLAIADVEEEDEALAFIAAARKAGCPVNIVDKPRFCDFQFGGIVNRSPLIVSISTDGAAPVFGQAVRAKIEAILPQSLKTWAQAAQDWRPAVQALALPFVKRRKFWEAFTAKALAGVSRAPTPDDQRELMSGIDTALEAKMGRVSLVGSGPGDPELLTLKAVRMLQSADVILYDTLVASPILEMARREAERILVGKTGHGPSCRQGDINGLIVKLAREGKHVVRLKSGDPLIFGRAGEEIEACRAAGIPLSIVPGISSAQGAAASIGISLTHRDYARRLQYITGHAKDGQLPKNMDWSALADIEATTVVYMPKYTLPALVENVLKAGLDPQTPAIAVMNATREGEKRVISTVEHLVQDVQVLEAQGPVLVLIGHAMGVMKCVAHKRGVSAPELHPDASA